MVLNAMSLERVSLEIRVDKREEPTLFFGQKCRSQGRRQK